MSQAYSKLCDPQYSDAGWYTCAGYPGSFGNEVRDIYTFREDWGFDYLKYSQFVGDASWNLIISG